MTRVHRLARDPTVLFLGVFLGELGWVGLDWIWERVFASLGCSAAGLYN